MKNNDTKSSTLKVCRHNILKRFKRWPGAWNVVSPRTCFVLFILLPRTEHQRVYLSSFSFQRAILGTFTSSKRSILLHPSVAVHV